MRRWLAVLFGMLLVSMVFVGCGGGDDDEASGDDVEAASSDDDGSDSGDSGDDSGSDNGNGSSAIGIFTAADCTRAVQALAAASASISLAFSGESEELEDSVKQMEEFADKAPDEIKDDLETLQKAYDDYASAIRESGWKPGEQPSEEQIETLEKASKELDSEEVQAAQKNVDEWFAEECGGS